MPNGQEIKLSTNKDMEEMLKEMFKRLVADIESEERLFWERINAR